MTVCAADKDVLFHVLRLEVAHGNCTPDRFIFHWDDLALTLERVEIENIDVLIRSVAEKQLTAAILHIDLRDGETDVLWHLVHELHLDCASDFVAFAPQDQLGDLLVAHVGRSVDFSAEILDFAHTRWLLNSDRSLFDETQVAANVLKDTEAGATGRAMACHLEGRVLVQVKHRLREHDGCLFASKGVE